MMIRAITPEDNQAIYDIIRDSLHRLGLDRPGTAYFDPQLSDLFNYYNSHENAAYCLVEVDGEVLGGVGIAPFDQSGRVCELQKLYLKPEAQSLGYAKKLMAAALCFATEHYERCYIETMQELEAACRLYESFGFTRLDKALTGSEHTAMNAWYIKDFGTDVIPGSDKEP